MTGPIRTDSREITRLLRAWASGDVAALDGLVPLVYEQLRRMARGYMRKERTSHTLPPTALVNEVFLRLVDARELRWNDRVHFFAACAGIMRRILVDAARSRRAVKRGGQVARIAHSTPIDWEGLAAAGSQTSRQLCALDDALTALARIDPRRARVVELRFFGGLSVGETGEVLRVSPQTVMRDWKLARAWLARELS